ncbi:MAG: exo-alpha-sialidase, partial [bacterium]|nr:exo-alpha-sialidase [bacterium]
MVWTPPGALNTNATSDSGADWSPQVTTDGLGHWVGVWYSYDDLAGTGTDSDIFVARSADNGMTWTASVPLNTNALTDSEHDGSPQVATDGLGHWVAAWESREDVSSAGTDFDILVARSTDNGVTWTAPVPLNTNASTDTEDDGAPRVATDGLGHWVAVWNSDENLLGAGTDDDLFVSRSTDNGATWTAPALLNANATADGFADDLWQQISTDGAGNWVTVWVAEVGSSDYDVFVACSTDNGASWTAPILLSDYGTTEEWPESHPQLANDGAGTWVTVWWGSDGLLGGETMFDLDIIVARSTDGGATWSAPALLKTNGTVDVGMDWNPHIAAGAVGDWVTVWASTENLSGASKNDTDIFVARSNDGGITWTDPGLLNYNATLDSGNDDVPWVATDRSNHWVTVWQSLEPNIGEGIGSDHDILFSVFPDTALPKVSSATAMDISTIRVAFDEYMTDDAALVDVANYTFTGNVALTATSVVLVDESTIDLPVNEMSDGAAYTVHIETDGAGPTDLAMNHVDPAYNSAAFSGLGEAPTAVISLLAAAPTGTDEVQFEVAFDESVTPTFDSGDV